VDGYTQRATDVIDIDRWCPDDRFAIYPEGTREKSLWISPQPAPMPFLAGGHRYLFKLASHRYPSQFWCEVIAYHLGCLMGVPVPPAYAAWQSGTRCSAALIEWFYREDESRYESGTGYMKMMIPDFDVGKGRQHNIITVLDVLTGIDPTMVPDMVRMLVFDALIGNTDRHQENWGIVYRHGSQPLPRLAPAFDNGTSLGHEIVDSRIAGFLDHPDRMARYIDRGTHHMRWSADGEQCLHVDLIVWLIDRYPDLRSMCARLLDFDMGKLETWLHTLSAFDMPGVPTTIRIQWINSLLRLRMERLQSVFAGLG
jgi:hypothetical protein